MTKFRNESIQSITLANKLRLYAAGNTCITDQAMLMEAAQKLDAFQQLQLNNQAWQTDLRNVTEERDRLAQKDRLKTTEYNILVHENRKLREALQAALNDIDLAAKIFSKQYHSAATELADHAEIYRAVLKGVASNS